jgi:glutathione reductase (NADPH)
MEKQYDVVVIGTGSGASVVASRCRAAGWTVAIIDARPFGGTCVLRGCHPKKMLVSAGEAIDAVQRMTGKGVRAREVGIDWAALEVGSVTARKPGGSSAFRLFSCFGV